MGKLLLPEGQFSVYVHRQAEKEFLLLSKPFLLCLSPILNPGLSCLLVLNPGIFLPPSCPKCCQQFQKFTKKILTCELHTFFPIPRQNQNYVQQDDNPTE